MWRPISLAGQRLPERIIGFSLPVDNQIALISYEGVHLLHVDDPVSIQDDPQHPEGAGLFDPASRTLVHRQKRYAILGLHGGRPRLTSDRGETLDLDLKNETLRILGPGRRVEFALRFDDLSGDWGMATFSEDSEVVVLGLPYDLHVVKRCGRETPSSTKDF